MYDIITFGSATIDIFLKPKQFKILKSKDFITGKGVCLPIGSKIDIENIVFATGGGGTNTAATFANQGFSTAYCGSVGSDLAGQEIIDEMAKLGVNTEFIIKASQKLTNHSIIISGFNEDRTILVYRGASEYLKNEDIPWDKLKAKWFYLAPLSGLLCDIFEPLIDFAKRNNIKVAINPGDTQLLMPSVKDIFKKVDILILNQEEASFLTKIPYKKEMEIFKKIDEICPGIVIMTKGTEGVVVSDGKTIYQAESLKTKVVDKTGAGDSFASGFVSAYINTGDIEKAIVLGTNNSSSCLKEWGAKNGLLKKNDAFQNIEIKKYEIK